MQLKNHLNSNDDVTRAAYQQRWLTLPDEIRNYVKVNVVGALGSEGYRPSAAAQCVQYVASTELPAGLWPNLIQTLVGNVTNANSTEMCKEATLEAIGYICQDIVRVFLMFFHKWSGSERNLLNCTFRTILAWRKSPTRS